MAGLIVLAPTWSKQKASHLYLHYFHIIYYFSGIPSAKHLKKKLQSTSNQKYKDFKMLRSVNPPNLLWTISTNLMGSIRNPLYFMQE